eukprot:COSAG05_NODE_10049_length_586_cov_0.882957_2_plen_49_part_01
MRHERTASWAGDGCLLLIRLIARRAGCLDQIRSDIHTHKQAYTKKKHLE